MAKNKSNLNDRLNAVSINSLASAALTILISASAGFGGGWLAANNGQNINRGSTNQQAILSESQVINEIVEKVGPSVVSIDVKGSARSGGFFGYYQDYETSSAGTGIILSSDGYIITNRHVVPEGTTDVNVTLSDGKVLEDVTVVGRTNQNDSLDIAFLKINDAEGAELRPATIGDSNALKVGDKVVAIGNALGQFENTVTSGIVSGFGRSVVAGDFYSSESLQNLIQTDTAINQGNSGGPLVNIDGEVIGVNTAVAGGGAENIGFAIPANDIKSLIASVLEKGVLERPYLGVRYAMLNPDLAARLDAGVETGAYVVQSQPASPSILPGSPAEKAGIKEEDVITKVDDQDINEKNTLSSVVSRYRVNDEVELTLVRNGEELKLKVVLLASPSQ
jgi:serine protease Do